ncbi:MAG: hypothetical protein GQ583_03260 [Methyloprofundus sp.]|nr:hypothetical protein [Methyloprofundus sp.]
MKKHTKNIISIAVVGKLASTTNLVSATSLGKQDNSSSSIAAPMSLDQIGYPLEILTPPVNISDSVINENNSGKVTSTETGTIYANDLGKAVDSGKQPRIDFIMNNIQQSNNTPVVVFLAYSTIKGDASQWLDLQLSNLILDRDTMKIISAFTVHPAQTFGPFNQESTPLGNITNKNGRSVIVSLNLNDLEHLDFDDDNIYFQAVSIPLVDGEFDFSSASVSELDHYKIERKTAGSEGSGSKVSTDENGSKSSGGDSSGSKFGDNGNGSTPEPENDNGGK